LLAPHRGAISGPRRDRLQGKGAFGVAGRYHTT
jgi:hypothetical protein